MADKVVKASEYLQPRILQIVGIIGFIAAMVFWIASGKQSALIMTSCLSLIGLGSYQKSVNKLTEVISERTNGG